MRFGLSMPENVIDRAIENEDGLIGTFLPRRQRGPPNNLNLLVVPAAVDVNARADTGIVNSVPAALGQSKGLHGGEDETPITKRTHNPFVFSRQCTTDELLEGCARD